MTPLQRLEDRQRATQTWVKICNALNVLRVSGDELKAICCVLAATYHIGLAGAAKGREILTVCVFVICHKVITSAVFTLQEHDVSAKKPAETSPYMCRIELFGSASWP